MLFRYDATPPLYAVIFIFVPFRFFFIISSFFFLDVSLFLFRRYFADDACQLEGNTHDTLFILLLFSPRHFFAMPSHDCLR